MLTMIIALALLFGVVAAIWYYTHEKSLRISLAVSVAIHAVMFIKFFSGSESFSAPVRDEILDFTFIPTLTESAATDAPQTASIDSIVGGVKIQRGKTRRRKAAEVKKDVDQPANNPEAERSEKELKPLEKMEWFDFNKHPGGASYRKRIHKLVHAHQVVPEQIEKKGWEAKIKVWFNLSREGKLNRVYIDKRYASNYNIINEASMQSVRDASKYFPPLPEGVKNFDVWFNVMLDFTRVRN
jgi:outer membrane biosynthesis protein TonB